MKILFVVEKPSTAKYFKEVIEEASFKDEFDFAYTGPIFHIEDSLFGFRLGEDGKVYNRREKINVYWLKLKSIDIPEKTFFTLKELEDIDVSGYDLIVGCPDIDVNGVLAFKKFVEKYNILDAKFIPMFDLTKEAIKKALELDNMMDFCDVWEKLVERFEEKGFSSNYPREVDVYKLRKSINWSRADFSRYFDIPYRTLENWEFFENECPKYLFNLMVYKLKNEKIL